MTTVTFLAGNTMTVTPQASTLVSFTVMCSFSSWLSPSAPHLILLLLSSLMLTAVDSTIIPSMGPAVMDPLLELVQRSFMVSNSTEPNLTPSCWLCYDTAPLIVRVSLLWDTTPWRLSMINAVGNLRPT